MKIPPLLLSLLVAAAPLFAAPPRKFDVVVTNDLDSPRPAETIVIPFAEVRRRLPDVRLDHVEVRRADTGGAIPSQVTNFHPDDRRALYDDLLFQHDFPAGEHEARFVVELTDAPMPPFPTKVFARHVPERLDDFAFENDRIAHRMYGPGLDTPAAGGSRMVSSGIDVWAKRVRYPIVDRWYLKGHNAYHADSGEGLDLYDVGTSRGDGGTGIWDGKTLHVSPNWTSARVLANGPIRAVFELTYAPWDAGNGVRVAERKRITVDAGSNLHRADSTFTVTPANHAITVALGLAKHAKLPGELTADPQTGWMSWWEKYPKPDEGELGTAVLLARPPAEGLAEDAANHLLLAKAHSGEPLGCYFGAGWNRSGDFADRAAWNAYVADFALRLKHPLALKLGEAQP
jgi:hypothetical protein